MRITSGREAYAHTGSFGSARAASKAEVEAKLNAILNGVVDSIARR